MSAPRALRNPRAASTASTPDLWQDIERAIVAVAGVLRHDTIPDDERTVLRDAIGSLLRMEAAISTDRADHPDPFDGMPS